MSDTDNIIATKSYGAREAHIIPLTYGRARIAIGPSGAYWYDDAW